MSEKFAYLDGFGSGGGSLTKSVIFVTAPTGSSVTCAKDGVTKTATEQNGQWRFNGIDNGTWTITAVLNGDTATQTVEVTQFDVYRVSVAFQLYPDDFTMTGTKGVDYEVVQDDDTVIPEADYRKYKNWKIRILTSGSATPKNNGNIDVFLVGGGESGGVGNSIYGGGGGSGRTKTVRGITLIQGRTYKVVIGAGGIAVKDITSNPGGSTSFDSHSVQGGGSRDQVNSGGPGGSGGRGGGGTSIPASNARAQDGADGIDGSGSSYTGGKGQGTTTREFGEPDGKLYAYGGILTDNPVDMEANTGDGGDGTYKNKTSLTSSGGSGIVIIRNAREVG